MVALRGVCLSAALICGVLGQMPAAAQTQSMPTVVAPPQQMTPYSANEAPPTYPPTYPSVYPSAYPSTYPSTAAPAPSAAVSPYDRPPSSLMASAAGIPGESPGPSLTANPGPLNAPNNSGPLSMPYGNPNAVATSQPLDPNSFVERNLTGDEVWSWQICPRA